jgi:serine/threonine protein kinase
MPSNTNLVQLSPADRQTVEAWLADFDTTWDENRLKARVRELPPAGSPLRLPALAEMVKLDLRHRWQAGQRARLEGYLKAYPELGTPATVAADVVLAEYEARCRAGAPDAWEKLASRFPRQVEALRRAKGGTQVPRPAGPPPAPASAEDARPTRSLRGSTNPGAQPTGAPELPEQFGRYRILQRLGQGGMGSVYLAHDSQLDRRVALKVPHFTAADGPDVLERFTREARAAATIDHPNVCPVYDVGTVNGISYVTMAYVEGKPLSELIREGKPLPQRPAAAVVRKLALALREAHQHGVIHRDLKPSNVMVNKRNEPVVMDFGLARRIGADDARLTKSGAILGTPAYMAPEQVRGEVKAVGPRSDIYSLGIILYELLTGELPFQGPTAAVLGQIMTQEPPPPVQLRPDLDAPLAAMCLKAMAKQPADRYASMAEFAAALSRYLKGEAGRADLPQAVPAGRALPQAVPAVPTAPGGEGAATQLLAKLAERLEAPPAPQPPANRHDGLRWWQLLGASVVILLILGGIAYIASRHGDTNVTVHTDVAVRLPEIKVPNPNVIIYLDGKQITVAQLNEPVSLKTGEDHKLVMKEGDKVLESRTFQVNKDDNNKTLTLPPPDPSELVQRLQGDLASKDPAVRRKAVQQILETGDRTAAGAMIVLLRDTEPDIRRRAAEILQRLGDQSAVQPLANRIGDDQWVYNDPEGGGKTAALQALTELAPDKVAGALLVALKSNNESVRAWACRCLAQEKDDETANGLIAALGDRVPAVRAAAAAALGGRRVAAAAPRLNELLSDRNGEVRRAAMGALTQTGGASAGALLRVLADPELPAVRVQAAAALQQLGDKAAVDGLVKRVGDDMWEYNDPDGGGKAAALQAVSALAKDRVGEALLGALRANKEPVRVWACGVLANQTGTSTTDGLIAVLQDTQPAVKAAAAYALGQRREKAAAEPLTKLLFDPDSKVREAAMGALTQTGGASVEALLHVLGDRQVPVVRRQAAEALRNTNLGDKKDGVVQALVMRVGDDLWEYNDPDGGGKAAALTTLRTLGPDRVGKALEGALGVTTKPKVREWACQEMAKEKDDATGRALKEKGVTDGEAVVRAAAAWALGERREASAQNDLTKLLSDPDAEVRRAAQKAIDNLTKK